ncbi:Ger(x)C family spore germination protein [Jeotgalibacillus salarius]|uniref:Ger(X)C family spore germination protein n=1 Tax=Jeotgalibacillus salarius TaxID=546023 RepID=A0A4Y8LC17_9BACL|nr:Ger(x)C family spore germination protein [Jeotgalibacillus salarius]TFD99797.1 Ger(x)C family spore germination protein [Jeotgalibacillus salarius]
MKKTLFFLHFFLYLFLSGCWDQNLLKDVQLVYTVGYDQTEDGRVQSTGLAPPIEESGKVNEITATGYSMNDSMFEMDLYIAEYADFSKLQAVLIGKSLAADSIYSFLDELYRNPRNNLHARIALTDLPANDLLLKPIDTQRNKSEYFKGLLESSELTSVISYMSLQDACTIIFNPGKDLFMPYITYDEKVKRAKVSGIALFHQNKYTEAYLNIEESVIFNLLNNTTKDLVRITRRVHDDRKLEVENWVTIEVKNSKSDLKVNRQLTQLKADLKFEIVILEYGQNKITKEKEEELKKILTDVLTEDVRQVLKKLQSSKSDALGIGNQVAAFHEELWDEGTWSDTYQQLDTQVTVELEMLGTGIID